MSAKSNEASNADAKRGTPGCCNVCGVSSTRNCSGCSLAIYCGREHQVADRKAHKKLCSRLQRVDTDSGRVVQAKVDIPMVDDLYPQKLMTVKPLLIIPDLPVTMELEHFKRVGGFLPPGVQVPCLGCYQITGIGSPYIDRQGRVCTGRCFKCGWPVHNDECAKRKDHVEECKFLQSRNRKHYDFQPTVQEFWCIGYLRALLLKLQKKPEWDSLINMPVQFPRKDPDFTVPEVVKNVMECEEKVKHFIYVKCGILKSFISETELDRLMLILKSNRLPSPQMTHEMKAYANFIFHGFQGRVLTHSCRPNCYLELDTRTLEGSVMTYRKITAGETLTINYDGGIELKALTLLSRNVQLQYVISCPPCTCPLCSDPTENGSYYSAVKCTKRKCSGYLVPTQPTSWSQSSKWTCTKPSCKWVVTLEQAEKVVLNAEEMYSVVVAKEGGWNNFEAGMKVIREVETKILHPNHYRVWSGYWSIFDKIITRMSEKKQYVPRIEFGSGEIVESGFSHHRQDNPKYLDIIERCLEILKVVQGDAAPLKFVLLFFKSLLRISAMAEEFREAQSKSDAEKVELIKISELEFRGIATDLNQHVNRLMTEPYVVGVAPMLPGIVATRAFLVRVYCSCLAMSLKLILTNTLLAEDSIFQQIVNEDWVARLKEQVNFGGLFLFKI